MPGSNLVLLDSYLLGDEIKLQNCPVCGVKMGFEGIVKHCKIKHKLNYKWCRPCEKYVLKKLYRMHIQTPIHKEFVQACEKHSGHESEEDNFETVDILEDNKTAVPTNNETVPAYDCGINIT